MKCKEHCNVRNVKGAAVHPNNKTYPLDGGQSLIWESESVSRNELRQQYFVPVSLLSSGTVREAVAGCGGSVMDDTILTKPAKIIKSQTSIVE